MLKGWEKIEPAQVFQKGEEREGKCHKFILKIKIPDIDSSKIWGRLSRDTMTLCSQSICCLWNIACCDLERSFTQKFVFPAWGVCNLNYKLHFLCCRFLIPQSLKCWIICEMKVSAIEEAVSSIRCHLKHILEHSFLILVYPFQTMWPHG